MFRASYSGLISYLQNFRKQTQYRYLSWPKIEKLTIEHVQKSYPMYPHPVEKTAGLQNSAGHNVFHKLTSHPRWEKSSRKEFVSSKNVTLLKYCTGKVFWIFSPLKYPLKRAVGQHCHGKTFSGPTSISQGVGFGRASRQQVYKSACPQKLSEIHDTETEKYILLCLSLGLGVGVWQREEPNSKRCPTNCQKYMLQKHRNAYKKSKTYCLCVILGVYQI